MANRDESSAAEDIHVVFVETSLETRLAIHVHKDENISDFKEKLCEEHKQVFPEIGDIKVSAFRVKRRRQFFYCPDSTNVCKAFEGISIKNWFMYVDAARVEESQMLTIMADDQNRSKNLELVEKKKEIDTVLGDGHTKDMNLEVVEKKTRKRKLISSDVKKSRKKSSIDVDQSCAIIPPKEKVDDILTGAVGKDIESGEKNGISMGDTQQTSDVDRVCQEKTATVNSEVVDGDTSGEVKDLHANNTLNHALETEFAMWKAKGSDESHKSSGEVPVEKLDDLRGAIEQDLRKGGETDDIVMIDQEKHLVPAIEPVDGHITSKDDVNESHELSKEVQVGAASEHCVILPKEKPERDTERGEGSILAPSAADNLQTSELVTHPENQLEVSSGLTSAPSKEKKRKRKKSSKDHINQSSAAAATTSSKIVNEINEASGNVDCANATTKPCIISERESSEKPLVEAVQKESEMGEKSVEDVGRDNIASHPENHLEANSGLTTSPVTQKKKRRKKISKDDISQSAATAIAAATTASREIVNEIHEVSGIVDRVDATSESCPISQIRNLGKENEMGEKINEDVGSGKAIPSTADNIQTDNLVSYPETQLEISSGLIIGPSTEKKKKQKKSSKDHTNQSSKVVNEREKVPGSIDHVDATSGSLPHSRGEKLDTIQNENETGDKFVDKVGSKEATQVGADEIQVVNSEQVAGLAHLDHIGKSTEEKASNENVEHEVSKETVEIDADQAKSVKSTKKKSSRKAKTPAKEDTQVASVENVEQIKVVEVVGHENVIRIVLDSLQQKNKTEEILDESGKKSSKRSKKKHPANTLEAQVLSAEVNNAAQEAHPINNPKDSDASFTPAKKDTESDASHLRKSTEVDDKTEDNNPSKQKDNADMGEVFVSTQRDNAVRGGNKQDQVTGEAKSKKEKKSFEMPKERKSTVQPASSGTSQLQSSVKNDRSVSKVDHSDASVKGTVNNKKESVKKISISATVNKSKMNVNNKKEAVKKSSNSVTVNKKKMNFFKSNEKSDSEEDEYKTYKTTLDLSAKTPSDSSLGNSSGDDSDVTSMSRKQGNNLGGETTNMFSGSLKDILRSSKSYKRAKLTASQQPDESDNESPNSQAC